ncbi:pyridoxamine 5'-phosphate oxidase family protein [Streptomyces sp. JJ38]|uniref:pyridoxamine 5'-phosphate oxidase family protein n=1 Tax=Streptomyces sp. JJ38 TaxID=2738128 RepID=UPI001C57864A|nr:pyridoxamine 5'-phosphate oxidase family protein [Streptomyces sp. JJ38]MBW1599058.1 pyridoxamine 5'-phosphate oxidase family protein [Streptomyces sp. JJ38]
MVRNDTFRALDRQVCLRLLAKVPIGRVVYTQQALPAILPVNFSMDSDASVLFHTVPGSDLIRAVDGAVVAFEADEFDVATRSGWSVVVTGRATVVTDPAAHARLSRADPLPWTPLGGGAGVFVRVESEVVTGRGVGGAHGLW